MNKKVQSSACMLGAAVLWGFAFVAQRDGMGEMEPFMFSALRMLIGSAALVPIFMFSDHVRKKAGEFRGKTKEEINAKKKTLFAGGISAAVVIFFAANLQQMGLVSVDAGKSAFITALYILLVPIMGIPLKKKTTLLNWIAAIIGAMGLYFLCIKGDFSIAWGDLLVLIGAFFWALHILVFDHYAPKVNVTKLVFLQFLFAGIISLAVAIIKEDNTLGMVIAAAPNLLYVGICSTAIAFTLQGIGQKYANPTAASIILSTESMFGAIFGAIFLGEVMAGRELLGCALMMAAILLSQLPTPGKGKSSKAEKRAGGKVHFK